MELRITATELARHLGDILAKVRFRKDTFVIERKGKPIARVIPWRVDDAATLGEALAAWRDVAPPDPDFARDLDRVNRADRPPKDPWA